MKAKLLARLARLETAREVYQALIFVLADSQLDSALSGFEIGGQIISRRPQESPEDFMDRIKRNTKEGLTIAMGVYE